MSKFMRVFLYEYTRHVLRKRFIFAVLSVPLFVVVVMAISIISAAMLEDSRPIGFVDDADFLTQAPPMGGSGFLFTEDVDMLPFPDEPSARAALDAGQIQTYFVIQSDYLESGSIKQVSVDNPDNRIVGQFSDYMRINLLTTVSPEVAHRVTEGSRFTISSADGSRQTGEEDWFNLILPIIAGVLFMIIIVTAGGYLMQAVVEEKENRTMEMIITSVSPGQLMAGKIIGNLSVGLTQMIIWVVLLLVAFMVGRNRLEWMNAINLDARYLGVLFAVLIPSFVLVGALMAAIGATVTEAREAQQISGLFTLPLFIPYWFVTAIMENPNGPLALGLSFFPLTAPVTISLRAAFTDIPVFQLILNITVLVLAAFIALWLAGRAFRLGMLSYGKRLGWKQLFKRSD